MSSIDHYHNISKYLLLQLTEYLEHTNSLVLTDHALSSENLIKDILNLAFDWDLVNANEAKSNQSAYDLVSYSRKIYIQITSNKSHKQKYEKSIASFKKLKVDTGRFIVFFISKKVHSKLLELKKIDGFHYEAYDIKKLLDEIYYSCTSVSKLGAINEILRDILHPVLYERPESPVKEIVHVINEQMPRSRPSGIYVNRIELVEKLFDFVQQNNGVLIGGPGYGKSVVLEELQRYCQERSTGCYIVRINDLGDGSNEEIGEELTLGKGWLEVLGTVPYTDFSPILIFDAYDTAKDERLKSNVLRAIKRSLSELSSNWRVLVSVRTYDATKSRTLLELFPTDNITNQVSCRNFQIPEFSDQEVENALESIVEFRGILKNCTPELKNLLRIPYFFKLFYLILNSNPERKKEFMAVESEEELLSVFWINKIADGLEKDLLLKNVTHQLSNTKSLSCDKILIINENNASVLSNLISTGILEEVTLMKQKIAFTHNILLDYAICRYLLHQEVDEQINYVNKNEKLPFLFRQSFIYFYSKLYKQDNELFWRHYFKINDHDSPLLRLMHQSILIYVLVQFYKAADELDIIFLQSDSEKRGYTVKKILEGIRFITKGKIRPKDADLIVNFSENLHHVYIWEIGQLIEKGIEHFSVGKQNTLVQKLSDASCNCFEYIWKMRNMSQYKDYLDINGGIRTVSNLCMTLSFNLDKVQEYFKNILLLFEEKDFPIGYFHSLAENILLIYRQDKELARIIFKTIYFHNEKSDKVTNLGSGVVMSLRSNRRQDYGMVLYNLDEKYPELLTYDFETAMLLGLEIYSSAHGTTIETNRKCAELTIGRLSSRICSDSSYYDFDEDSGPTSYARKILENIEENFVDRKKYSTGIYQTKLLIPRIEHAMVWRGLFKMFIKFPEATKDIVFDLLCNRAFFTFRETAYESGELIRAVWPHFAVTRRRKIENQVISLISDPEFKGNRIYANHRINQLLNCIPLGKLTSAEARTIVQNSKIVSNAPLIQDGNLLADVSFSTRQEKIARAGFDIESTEDMSDFEKIEKIEDFNNRIGSSQEEFKKSDASDLLSLVESLFLACSAWSENKRIGAELEIARFISIFSRVGNDLNNHERNLIKQIAFRYTKDESYDKKEYEVGQMKERWSVYGPTPKSAALGCLLNLMYSFREADVEELVLMLMADNDKTVRHRSLKGLRYFWKNKKDSFWEIVNERGGIEEDGLCINQLMLAVCNSEIMSADCKYVEEFISLQFSRVRAAGKEVSQDYWSMIVVILLRLFLYQESSTARKIISDNLDLNAFCKSLILEIMRTIDPHSPKNNYKSEPEKYEQFLDIIKELLCCRYGRIQDDSISLDDKTDDFKTVDHVIQHLYFILVAGKGENKGNLITEGNRLAFYGKIKPLVGYVVEQSILFESGYMIAHTGYYFIQILICMFDLDPENLLSHSSSIVLCSSRTGFTYDRATLIEVVKLTEHIIANHKELLYKGDNFSKILAMLDLFSNSGWQEAMELTWRLKEAF